MKGADWTLGVFLKVVKIGCLKPVGNCIKNAQVQLQRLLHLIEDATNAIGGNVARYFFDLAIAKEENIDLGPDEFYGFGQLQCILSGRPDAARSQQMTSQELTQHRIV